MRPKTEKQAITRIFLWIFSGIICLDLFYEGKVEQGVANILVGIFSMALVLISFAFFSDYNPGAGIFSLILGLLLFIAFTIKAVKRLFQYLRMFEQTED
tara:strand:- start:229 stop:525 length:297 start_codon:yes stop_codon:yes gene_type:complete